MKTTQQALGCSECGEIRLELLTEEDAATLQDIAGTINRACVRCGKSTGWGVTDYLPVQAKNTLPRPLQVQLESVRIADDHIIKGQERMATQAERDNVNSMVQNSAHEN